MALSEVEEAFVEVNNAVIGGTVVRCCLACSDTLHLYSVHSTLTHGSSFPDISV